MPSAIRTYLGPHEVLAPLAERSFRLLFVGQFVSLFGTGMAPVALAFAVLDLAGSGAALGVTLAAASLPQILFLLIGGVWADRLPRHALMIWSNIAAGSAQAVAAVLVLLGAAHLWELVALQVARGIASAFFRPAYAGIVPLVVSRERLQQANALLAFTFNITGIGAAAAGGVLVAFAGPGWALAIDAGSYAVSSLFLARIHLPTSLVRAQNFTRDLAEGWREFISRSWLWSIVVGFAFINASYVGAIQVLGPIVAKRQFGGAAAWGLVLAAQSCGLLVGSAAVLRIRPRRPLLVAQCAILSIAVPIGFLAAGASRTAVVGASFLAGVGLSVFSILWRTALQENVPLDRLSRVSSYDALGSFAFIPIGLATAGPVADSIGVAPTLWLAFATITLAAAAPLFIPSVRHLTRISDPSGSPS